MIRLEQYYYDMFNPEYNQIRPCENNFLDDEVRKRSKKGSINNGKILQNLYSKDEYKLLFKENQRDRMIEVEMILNDEVVKVFESLSEAQRWLNDNTKYQGKNKVSKIREVCIGTRKSAFGYKWRFKNK